MTCDTRAGRPRDGSGTRRRGAARGVALTLAFMSALALGAPSAGLAQNAAGPQPGASEATRLALEEAELRERLTTALAIAVGVRLRGRTVLVAETEVSRVRRTLSRLDPFDPAHARLSARLEKLQSRQVELERALDNEFESYLEIVAGLSTDLRPRLARVASDLGRRLEAQRLGDLASMLPVLRSHIDALVREPTALRRLASAWRREIDDTYEDRRRRALGAPRQVTPGLRKEDI